MRTKKVMVSEKTNSRGISDVRYDIKEGRIRARATVTLCNDARKRLQGQGNNKRDALNALRKNVERENNLIQYGEQKESGDITLIAAVQDLIHERAQEYDRSKGREARRDSSIARDQDSLKYLITPSPIGKKKLTHIFCRDLDNYMHWLANAQYDRGRGKTHSYQFYSASSLNRAIRLVKSVIDDFYKYRPEKSPTDVLHFFKQHVRSKTSEDFLTGEEFEQAIRYFEYCRDERRYYMDPIYADLAILMMYTGLRAGEALGLRVENWDPTTGILHITHTGRFTDRTKTEESKGNFKVPAKIADILNRRVQYKKRTELIFQNTRGNLISESCFNKKVKSWLQQAGIKKNLHLHSLRGSCGTYLLDHGVAPEAVQHLLRHSTLNTTMKYYSAYTNTQKNRDQEIINGVMNSI